MKTYKTPALTDITLGEFEIDGEKHTVVGVIPFIAAVAAVANAKQTYNDSYMDSQVINTLEKVE